MNILGFRYFFFCISGKVQPWHWIKKITRLISRFLLLCPAVYKPFAVVSVLLLVLKLDTPHHDFLMSVSGVNRFILHVHSGHQHPVHTLYPLSSSSSVLGELLKKCRKYHENQNQIHRNCHWEERYSQHCDLSLYPCNVQVTEAGGSSSSLSSAT